MHPKQGGVRGGGRESPPTRGTMVHRWFKGEGWAGAGLYNSAGKRGLAVLLGQYPTIFQAAVFAILHCAETLVSEKASGRCISICSDCNGICNGYFYLKSGSGT